MDYQLEPLVHFNIRITNWLCGYWYHLSYGFEKNAAESECSTLWQIKRL